MLIEFSVSNFRSFREKQTLSMVAVPRLRLRENVFQPDLLGEKFPPLLKVAVIYGPNASGKSNLLKALNVVWLIARREPSARETLLPVSPFRFDSALANQPSEFDLHFIHRGIRYQFEFAATPERIVMERLVMFPKGRELLLYERRHSAEGEKYTFGALEGGADLIDTWRKLTPPQMFFMAQAVANSNEEQGQLKAPFEWLSESTLSLLNGMDAMSKATRNLLRKSPVHAADIASFLREVDVPISEITVESIPTPNNALQGLRAISDMTESSSMPGSAMPIKDRTTLTHKTALGEANLTYEEQSEGTKNLIGFWLPWTTKDNVSGHSPRCVLIVDELDSSLHPKIVAALVARHTKSSTPSQLIFTTHDTHLMDAKLLRRDQFWITERDANGATQLRAIHDFEGREGEDIEKRYYEGRYRGLPLIKGN